MSEAAIERAAREATLANRIYRSEGDLWTDVPINLSKFVRFLALQPYVVTGDVAQCAGMREALEPFAKISLWRDMYPDAKEDFLTARQLQGYIKVEDVRRARAALAAYGGEK